ncbi:MAG: KOW domain-containing RNA-binding protein [Clostridia bacterium]|nr:KOW domain-containing RNA-binding protein [Clostridia bacterium]
MSENIYPSVGGVCVSLTGHDAGMLFILIGMRNDKALLVNGKQRKISNPKTKNYKHISILSMLPDCSVERIKVGSIKDNEIIHQLKIAKRELLK